MKNLKLFLTLCLLMLASTSLYAQDYYVCDTGNDNNDGKSEATPFKTYEKGLSQFNQLLGGESVLFCRGGVFASEVNRHLYNPKCSESALCTIGAYGDVSKERPTLFVKNVTAALYFTEGGDPNKDGGYYVKDLILMSDESSATGVKILNDVDDLTLDNLHIQGFTIGVHSVASVGALSGDLNGMNDRLVLKNSIIIDNPGQGWLGGCVDCLIENNQFTNNGFGKAVFNHNIYLSGNETYVTDGLTIRGNTLYQSTLIDGKCQGVSLVGHGVMKNVLIENNMIKEDEGAATGHCWGIAIDTGYSKEESFYGLTIRNNTVLNVGGLAIGCNSCVDATIEGNTIIDPAGTLHDAIRVPNREEDTVKSKNVKISNNKIYLNEGKDSGIVIGGENVFSVAGNELNMPENATGQCIKRYGANSNTDISSNKCLTYTDLSFIDLETGEEKTTGDVSNVSIIQVQEPEPVFLAEPQVRGNSVEQVNETIDEPAEGTVGAAEDPIETVVKDDVIKSTTYKPGAIFANSSGSASGSKSCQAYGRGRCLLFSK
ncbi:MAG: right-handed parallel beta-helix repeat-containing protein [Proteobacteria bacterium]|nr:right-handed parallel beta-helix repeat-containing protein [Pseudomonadota bacterium]